MASGDGPSQMPGMLLGTYGKDPMSLVDGRGVVLPSAAKPDLQQRPWIPDERDAFISWLRGEFAAANAIIDALCYHLQMIGKPGEYDYVLTCIQQRRYNWTVVLHMQQYFSVAEVTLALQRVMWQKKQPLASDPQHVVPSQPFYTSPEVDGGGNLRMETPNGVHDPRELRGDSLIPRFLSMPPQPAGLVGQRAISESGRSDISNEGGGGLQGTETLPEVAAIPGGPHSARPHDAFEGPKHSESNARVSEDPEPSSSSSHQKTGRHSHQEHAGAGAGADEAQVEECVNGDVKERCAPEERASPPTTQNSSHEDEQRPTGTHKPSRCFSCSEAVDGKVVNVAEGLELFENVLDVSETTRLSVLISDLQAAGRRGAKRGSNGKGRETLQFGGLHPDSYNDPAEPMPAFLSVIVDRLVGGRIIPSNKVPDCCSIHILDEGDYLPPHIDHSHIERPFYMLPLLSECTLVLGQMLTMDAPGDFKGAFHLPLHAGSVLALQGNSADVARHALASSPTKRICITLGKSIPTTKASRLPPPQMASLPHAGSPSVPVSSPPSWSPAFNNRLLTQASKGQNFPNAKLHMLPASGVLPVPNVRPPNVQVMQSLAGAPMTNMQPLLPTAPGHAGAYPPMAVLPQTPWSVVAIPPGGPPSRAPSAGTGVFFPSGGVSSGPGRPAATTPQRRQGAAPQQQQPPLALLQKTNSLPSSFSSPAPSPSPTKSGRSGHLGGGDRGDRPLLPTHSRSFSGTTAQELCAAASRRSGSGDRPLLPSHSRSFSGTSAYELSGLGRVNGRDVADFRPALLAGGGGGQSLKEAEQRPEARSNPDLARDGGDRPSGGGAPDC